MSRKACQRHGELRIQGKSRVYDYHIRRTAASLSRTNDWKRTRAKSRRTNEKVTRDMMKIRYIDAAILLCKNVQI